jgi:hypothetical protein
VRHLPPFGRDEKSGYPLLGKAPGKRDDRIKAHDGHTQGPCLYCNSSANSPRKTFYKKIKDMKYIANNFYTLHPVYIINRERDIEFYTVG